MWGPLHQHNGTCPDLHTVAPDLVRPPMRTDGTPPGPGRRVRAVEPSFAGTLAYHALYLPLEWVPPHNVSSPQPSPAVYDAAMTTTTNVAAAVVAATNATAAVAAATANVTAAAAPTKWPVIVEYMGNGPWHDSTGDVSTGRPEDSNLGYGIGAGRKYIWISMPFLTSDLGNATNISTYWWGCPTTAPTASCGAAYDVAPTLNYLHRTLAQVFDEYGGDPERVVLTGWSRGAIACGAVGLHDDATSALFKAFIPYSHLDGDCGWADNQGDPAAITARYARLRGRPVLSIGECNVATEGGADFLAKLGVLNDTGNFTFATTGYANHNDAWILRPTPARDALRAWLDAALEQ